MIFFGKKRKHKLPKFPASVRTEFYRCCEDAETANIDQLKEELRKHHLEDSALSTQHETSFNADDALALIEVCEYLLKIYPERSSAERKLIVGAVKYVVFAGDAFCDHSFASGLTDDKQVINYVLEELGIEDRYFNTY